MLEKNKNNIFNIDNKQYDFNLYQPNLVNPYDQMYITPTGECYIVREEKSNNYLSHYEFAKRLVNSIIFTERENEEQKTNPFAKKWQQEKKYYDQTQYQEWSYLVNEKGFILFSPPPYNGENMPMPKEYLPYNLDLLTQKQINIFLNFYEFNGKLSLPEDLEQYLYNKIINKENKQNRK